MGKHLTLERKKKIKKMLDSGLSRSAIARELGVSSSTIYREVTHGTVKGEYDPLFSDKKYRHSLQGKGAPAIISADPALAAYIAELILNDGLGVNEIIRTLQNDKRFKRCPKSTHTIYSAIDDGLIPGVTRDDLHPDTTYVYGDGIVHIPRKVRTLLHIEIGDELTYQVIGNKWILRKKE